MNGLKSFNDKIIKPLNKKWYAHRDSPSIRRAPDDHRANPETMKKWYAHRDSNPKPPGP